MVAHVQTKSTIGGSGTTIAVTITSTPGNTLVLVTAAFSTTNTAFHVSSISDTHNTWQFSTANSNQNPPVGQSFDGDILGLSLIGAVINAAGVTSVTVTYSKSLDYIDAAVYEFSGVPGNAQLITAASSSTNLSGTSAATPSVTVPASASLAAALITNDGATITGVSGGWTLDGGSDNFAAWQVAPAPGSLAATFSGGSQNWPSSAIAVIGPPPATAPGLVKVGIV